MSVAELIIFPGKEERMAKVSLTLEVPADGLTHSGAVVGYNDHQVVSLVQRDESVTIEALKVGDAWVDLTVWESSESPACTAAKVCIPRENPRTRMTPALVKPLTQVVHTLLANHEHLIAPDKAGKRSRSRVWRTGKGGTSMATAELQFIEEGARVVIRCAKCVLVLPQDVFVEGIKAGKRLRRQQALQARQPYPTGGDDGTVVR